MGAGAGGHSPYPPNTMASALLRLSGKSPKPAIQLLGAGLFVLFISPFLGQNAIVAGQILLILGVVTLACSKERPLLVRPVPGSAICLILFLIFGLISILVNWEGLDDPAYNLKSLRHPLIAVAVALLVLARRILLDEREWATWAIRINIGLMVISVFFGVAVAAFDINLPGLKEATVKTDRIAGLDGEIMSFALNIQLLVLLLASLLLVRKGQPSLFGLPPWFLVAACLVGVAGLYLTYSRGPLLALIGGLVLLGSMISRRFIYATMALALLLAALAFSTKSRYFQFDESADYRIKFWKTALVTIKEAPVFGIGYREFIHHLADLEGGLGVREEIVRDRPDSPPRRVKQKFGHCHNNYLEAFVSTGVAGGLCFIGFFAFWSWEVFRSREHRVYFIPLLASILVTGLFDSTFFDGEGSTPIFLIYLACQTLIAPPGPTSEGNESSGMPHQE